MCRPIKDWILSKSPCSQHLSLLNPIRRKHRIPLVFNHSFLLNILCQRLFPSASVIRPLFSASFRISPVVMSASPNSSIYVLTSRKLLLATTPPLAFANAIAEASPLPMIRCPGSGQETNFRYDYQRLYLL